MSEEARKYLVPEHATFWRWTDGGQVIAWRNGPTITFRPELLSVLRRLTPQGLPPLGSVLLLLAATRDNWKESSLATGMLTKLLGVYGVTGDGYTLVQSTKRGLEEVNRLPPELRNTLAARETLAEVVFEGLRHPTTPELAEAVVRLLEDGIGEGPAEETDFAALWNRGPVVPAEEMQALQPGLDRIDPEQLRLRIKTGLDETPRPADVELPLAQRVRALLADLEEDNELRGLARVARNLMAAVTLPRGVSDREELPIGGVTDITNRGPLDRLLLSELAHDDLTLAVRVALNEALYLRRESPPRTPMRHRAVLLEAGIRSWGVPRVFATAVGLALAATADHHTDLVSFRAKGARVEPVDLTTRDGLIAHLAALEPELHPGAALDAFRAAWDDGDAAVGPVLVTTEDVLDDADFQRAVAAAELAPLYVATVHRSGRFRLVERNTRGSRVLREAQLALDDLFAPPRPMAPKLVDPALSRDLPAILSVRPFPLLLPHSVDPGRTWRVEGLGVLAVTNDRRLMLWNHGHRAATQIADDLPPGALWWASHRPDEHQRIDAVVGRAASGRLHLLHIDLDRISYQSLTVEVDPGVRAVCDHNGALFAVHRNDVSVISRETGQRVQRARLPMGMTWMRDRFFQSRPAARWYALSYDGQKARLERVFDETKATAPPLQTLFERDGVEGPIGVTVEGHLYYTATDELRRVDHKLPGNPQVAAISPNGRWVVLRFAHSASHVRASAVDVDTLAVHNWYGDPKAPAESIHDLVHPTSLRNQFVQIDLERGGALTLTSRKGIRLAIQYNAPNDSIYLRPGAQVQGSRLARTFKEATAPPGVGYRLSVATWDDGSRAFLDSRGMLHLKSSDPSVPEVSLVLNDPNLAGWCSDGRLWGGRYFIGDQPGPPQWEVLKSTIQAFCERLS